MPMSQTSDMPNSEKRANGCGMTVWQKWRKSVSEAGCHTAETESHNVSKRGRNACNVSTEKPPSFSSIRRDRQPFQTVLRAEYGS